MVVTSKTRAWITPSSLPLYQGQIIISVPRQDDWETCLLGAVWSLCEPWNWEQVDGITAAEAAAGFVATFDSLLGALQNLHIGEIFPYAASEPPGGCLLCDGSQMMQAAYPELYALIGDVFGSAASGYFKLPNLTRRTVFGAGGSWDIADQIGDETRSLDTGNLPSHNHSVHAHLEGVAVTPGELPVTLPDLINGTTGNTGSGDSFDIVSPGLVLIWCIRAIPVAFSIP